MALQEIKKDQIFTLNTQLTAYLSMYQTLICYFARIIMKHRMNHSDILLDKNLMTSSNNLETSTAWGQMAVPEWLVERTPENEQALRSCTYFNGID